MTEIIILMIIIFICIIIINKKNNLINNLKTDKIEYLKQYKEALKRELEISKKLTFLLKENLKLKDDILDMGYIIHKSIEPDDIGQMFDSFNDSFNEKLNYNKNVKKYNTDDILTEIYKNGISNVSKEKMDFLKNNKL